MEKKILIMWLIVLAAWTVSRCVEVQNKKDECYQAAPVSTGAAELGEAK